MEHKYTCLSKILTFNNVKTCGTCNYQYFGLKKSRSLLHERSRGDSTSIRSCTLAFTMHLAFKPSQSPIQGTSFITVRRNVWCQGYIISPPPHLLQPLESSARLLCRNNCITKEMQKLIQTRPRSISMLWRVIWDVNEGCFLFISVMNYLNSKYLVICPSGGSSMWYAFYIHI
jgi:hypothetical protein